MMKTLIISGHPDLSTSVANQTILEELEKPFRTQKSVSWISSIRMPSSM